MWHNFVSAMGGIVGAVVVLVIALGMAAGGRIIIGGLAAGVITGAVIFIGGILGAASEKHDQKEEDAATHAH